MKLCAHGAAEVTEAGYGSQGIQECTERVGEVSHLAFRSCKEQNKAQVSIKACNFEIWQLYITRNSRYKSINQTLLARLAKSKEMFFQAQRDLGPLLA